MLCAADNHNDVCHICEKGFSDNFMAGTCKESTFSFLQVVSRLFYKLQHQLEPLPRGINGNSTKKLF